jgi:hypothetical protein
VATAAVPDGVVVEVVAGATDSSPSQERLLRIAAMLRDAELAMPGTSDRTRRGRRDQRVRGAA